MSNGAIKPFEKHVEAIRSFFALCEQVSYAYTIKEQLLPFRELVKTKEKKFFIGMNS